MNTETMALVRRLEQLFSDDSSPMHLSGQGDVAELERKLARFYGVRYAILVANATLGLLAVAIALGLRRAEFVTTPWTYGASLSGWLLLENRPVFADVDPMTLTLDPEAVRTTITSSTRAILAVDTYGVPCDSEALRALADEYGLWYVADGAQSFGATRSGLPASALADAIVISFTVGKTLFAGEGGAILTNNPELYEKLLWYTQHPSRQSRELGLSLTNEFAINARIHPAAAVWANMCFEEALQKLRVHQAECFRLIRIMNSTGLTEPIDFESRGIVPTFFRLTAAWKGHPAPAKLARALNEGGGAGQVRILSRPAVPIYRHPAFVAQYGRRRPTRCKEAERQAAKRFLVLRVPPGSSAGRVPRNRPSRLAGDSQLK